MSAAEGLHDAALSPEPYATSVLAPSGLASNKSLHSFGSVFGRFIALLLAPFVLLASALFIPLILLSSNESPIWRQKRVGYRGNDIRIPKFSTMNAAPSGELRETWFGRFVRPTGLDEILQVFLIVKGDMQWFGPRPLLRKDLNELYINSVLSHTRPGLFSSRSLATGIGNRALQEGGISMAEMIRYDLSDLEKWSFPYASRMLLGTLAMVVRVGMKLVRSRAGRAT